MARSLRRRCFLGAGILAVAVVLLTSSTSAQCEASQLFAPLAGAGDSFGRSAMFNGDELVVGSDYSATIFARDISGTPLDATDDKWTVRANFLGGSPDDGFGRAVSLDGNYVIVGAPFEGGFVINGAAYVFRRDDGDTPSDATDDTWAFHSKLSPPTLDIGAFGGDVAVRGSWLAVSDFLGHPVTGSPQTGFVQIVRLDNSGTPMDPADDVWVSHSTLLPPDGGSSFGLVLGLTDKELLITGLSPAANRQVYRFALDDSGTAADPADDTWIFTGLIHPPSAPETGFGRAMAQDDGTLIIGSNDLVHVYRFDNGGTSTALLDDAWWYVSTLAAEEDTEFDDAFGCSIAMDGCRALIGARKQGTPFSTGAAYLFSQDRFGIWKEVMQLTSPNGQTAKNFGITVCMLGNLGMIGESGFFQALTPGDSAIGSAWLYAMAEPPWMFIDSALSPSEGATPCLLGTGPLSANSEVAITLKGLPASDVVVLVAGTAVVSLPFKGGVLVPAPQIIRWMPTGPAGSVHLQARWPASMPSDFEICLQGWMASRTGPAGFISTNAVLAEVP